MGNVLVVDDELDICTLVTRQLRSNGIEAEYALTIKEALLKTAFNPYDLYIIDLNLTDGSGFTLMQKIKEMQVHSKIIIISAYDGESKKAISNGADLFVPKPLSKRVIDDALHAVNFV
jgi:two-component system, OmpR family, response regulator